MNFTFTITEAEDVKVLHIHGKILDNQNDSILLSELGKVDKSQKWIFDLAKLETVNSSGLNLLLKCFAKIRTQGGELMFCSPTPSVDKLFTITKLNTVFLLVPNIEEGIKQLSTTTV